MHESERSGSEFHSARTFCGGAGACEQRLPHALPQRIGEPCTCHHSTALPPVVTVRPAIVACYVARYSES